MSKSLLCLALGAITCQTAQAYNFTRANQQFSKRMEGSTDQEKFASATAARSLYDAALRDGSLTQEEKIFAVSQIGRLDLVRAGFLPGIGKKERRKALEACIQATDHISNTGRQEYYYYYVACVALRGKLADGFIDRAKYGLKMKNVQNAALSSTKVNGSYVGGYEAGGILRIMSALRGNRKAKPLGLYNPQEGVDFAKIALTTRRDTYPPFTSQYSGKDYYENHFYFGQAVIALGLDKKDKATVQKGATLLTQKADHIDQNGESMPSERKPERDHYAKRMRELAAQVKNCAVRSDWADCLTKELEKED